MDDTESKNKICTPSQEDNQLVASIMREALEGRYPELTQNKIHTLKPGGKSFTSSPFLTKYFSINSPCGLEEELLVLKRHLSYWSGYYQFETAYRAACFHKKLFRSG